MSAANREYQVIFMPSGRRGTAKSGESLLAAARRLGVEIESICGGRLTCAKCKVRVEEGHFAKHGIHSTATHLTPTDEREAALLARTNGDGAAHDYRLAHPKAIQLAYDFPDQTPERLEQITEQTQQLERDYFATHPQA